MNNAQLSEMSKKQLNNRGKWEVILQNDNSISFDHVITCLVEICGHNEYQAGQCALLTDAKGWCSVFVDRHDQCEHVLEMLIKGGLTVKIKKYKK
tara:strand:- start:885 stop:1169 length:285 start_codon:yes stop_codon:yes gene_type:complete